MLQAILVSNSSSVCKHDSYPSVPAPAPAAASPLLSHISHTPPFTGHSSSSSSSSSSRFTVSMRATPHLTSPFYCLKATPPLPDTAPASVAAGAEGSQKVRGLRTVSLSQSYPSFTGHSTISFTESNSKLSHLSIPPHYPTLCRSYPASALHHTAHSSYPTYLPSALRPVPPRRDE